MVDEGGISADETDKRGTTCSTSEDEFGVAVPEEEVSVGVDQPDCDGDSISGWAGS